MSGNGNAPSSAWRLQYDLQRWFHNNGGEGHGIERTVQITAKEVTMQYENILVLWELHPYIVMRDYGPHKKSVYVYSPIKKPTLKD